jgi:hypothetical protein
MRPEQGAPGDRNIAGSGLLEESDRIHQMASISAAGRQAGSQAGRQAAKQAV